MPIDPDEGKTEIDFWSVIHVMRRTTMWKSEFVREIVETECGRVLCFFLPVPGSLHDVIDDVLGNSSFRFHHREQPASRDQPSVIEHDVTKRVSEEKPAISSCRDFPIDG